MFNNITQLPKDKIQAIEDVILQAVNRFSSDMKKDCQIAIRLNPNDHSALEYFMVTDYKDFTPISFKKILGVKLDILGKEMISTPIIILAIKDWATKLNISLEKFVAWGVKTPEGNIACAIADGNTFVNTISFEQLFVNQTISEEDI